MSLSSGAMYRSEAEQISHIAGLTAFDADAKYGLPHGAENGLGWGHVERREIHENYWGDFVGGFIRDRLKSGGDFHSFWLDTNYYEFMSGSAKGLSLYRD